MSRLALSFAALPVSAQAPQPAGAEFQVNTYTTGSQRDPSAAAAALILLLAAGFALRRRI